jgi:hypothetical protein
MHVMRRIKQIIEALRVITSTPSEKIASAWMTIQHNIKEDASTPRIMEHVMLVNKIIGAVVGLAEEMERPAKAEEVKS